jgi:putative intracellular protease/amidase
LPELAHINRNSALDRVLTCYLEQDTFFFMTTASIRHSSPHRVLILIAQGFDEISLVQCLAQMREAGLGVSLVSLSARPMDSIHGLTVRPDLLIDQLPVTTLPRLVIIPGGSSCAAALMADPRVHQLIETVLNRSGVVAAMSTAQSVLVNAGGPETSVSNFVVQNNLPVSEFVGQLINMALG